MNSREDNLDEVLQSEEIFSNAVQGDLCPTGVIESSFPGMKKRDVIKMVEILTNQDP